MASVRLYHFLQCLSVAPDELTEGLPVPLLPRHQSRYVSVAGGPEWTDNALQPPDSGSEGLILEAIAVYLGVPPAINVALRKGKMLQAHTSDEL